MARNTRPPDRTAWTVERGRARALRYAGPRRTARGSIRPRTIVSETDLRRCAPDGAPGWVGRSPPRPRALNKPLRLVPSAGISAKPSPRIIRSSGRPPYLRRRSLIGDCCGASTAVGSGPRSLALVWRAHERPAPPGGGEVPPAATGRSPVVRALSTRQRYLRVETPTTRSRHGRCRWANCAGIDWASENHDLLIEDPAGRCCWSRRCARRGRDYGHLQRAVATRGRARRDRTPRRAVGGPDPRRGHPGGGAASQPGRSVA